MANDQLKPAVSLLLVLNFCMYVILACIGGWAIHVSIDQAFIIGPELALPAYFRPIFFPIGNFATGFFVLFAVIAGVIGAASAVAGSNHLRFWNYDSLQPALSTGLIAWVLTLLSMGLAWKEIHFGGRNAKLRTMEAFSIILSVTQLCYILAIHGGNDRRIRM
ncbi:hypothetical protein LUZ60_009948 [Juncus effusus]|nr:hypothetical protein LUZ60_009948 [Juncus effusus]